MCRKSLLSINPSNETQKMVFKICSFQLKKKMNNFWVANLIYLFISVVENSGSQINMKTFCAAFDTEKLFSLVDLYIFFCQKEDITLLQLIKLPIVQAMLGAVHKQHWHYEVGRWYWKMQIFPDILPSKIVN